MLAAVLHETGAADVFRFEDLPIPEPQPGEVLLRVRAVGVSYKDVVERNGTYRRDVVLPLVIGMEIAGEVMALGAGVSRLRSGDRVCTKAFSSCGNCRYCRSGRETTCRQRRPVRGGYAQYTALPEDALATIPAKLSYEVACMLGPGAGVALNAVRDTAKVELGDTVLVTGATGGVGLSSVQIARHAGARVIAVTRSPAKHDFLMQHGAHEVVIARDGEDFSRGVRPLTRDGEGVDVVIDTVGSAVFDAAFNSLAPHGRYALVGQLTAETICINPARIFFKRAQLLGVGSVSRRQLEDVIALTAQGAISPQVAAVMPLTELAQAHRLVEEGKVAGRVVLTP
jgi:NADPH:quinone reductase-like Zn-dependent oxidoreductase